MPSAGTSCDIMIGKRQHIEAKKDALIKKTQNKENDDTALTKNVEPPAQETRVVTNTLKLLKESHKLRRIIARWMDVLVQRDQIRVYACMQLD